MSAALAATQGCSCGTPNPGQDGGTGASGGGGGGGSSGGGTGGGSGGGATIALRPAIDIISGTGRVTGGNFVMTVQVGQGMPQAPTTGGGRIIQGNTAIKR
jgi:hypothetical protein